MPRAQVMGQDAESGKMTIHKDGLMTFPVQGYLSGKSQHTGCAVCHGPLSGQKPLGQDQQGPKWPHARSPSGLLLSESWSILQQAHKDNGPLLQNPNYTREFPRLTTQTAGKS